jgi:galactokinase
MIQQALIEAFATRFGNSPARCYFSPGRVNLIGEYTDFNGGYVLPAAIDLGTYYAVSPNGKQVINVYSETLNEQRSLSREAISHMTAEGTWHDYVVGTLRELLKLGLDGEGLDIFVTSDLPQSSGLSSSASFTTGLAFLFNDSWRGDIERIDLVHLARRVENDFVGVHCGIMDQFAVAMGKVEHCIYLHCQSLEYELVPVHMDGYEIVIADSRVPRRLAASAYNERRAECDAALAALRNIRHLECLVDASLDEVETCNALEALPLPRKRARHVISENGRVQSSVAALRNGDLEHFGNLMQASHASLRDDFEVSCAELDTLVEAAMRVSGVLGSRMTGAGFGGCTVSLVPTHAVDEFIDNVSKAYSEATPYQARIFRTHPGDGVKRLDL